ncbi:MAG: polysaccharide biosynthesis tyrosine autokinase [Clostridia bacterium]|nr:polysaccharide biosynthesis tyrosine autokinase [Clostridia bacterium]
MAGNTIIEQYYNAGPVLHDAVKTLRTNIWFSSVDREVKTIVVTGAVPNNGKSTLTIFLGIAMAESGHRTLLVECDCRRPMLQNYLKIRPEYNLVDVLAQKTSAESAIVHTAVEMLDLLSAMALASPVEILSSNRFNTILAEQRKHYDVILMDTPPLSSFIEAAILASRADGTLLVLQSGGTEIGAAQAAVAQLEKAKARILGVVLNNVDMATEDYYYPDYYYRDGKKKKRKEP